MINTKPTGDTSPPHEERGGFRREEIIKATYEKWQELRKQRNYPEADRWKGMLRKLKRL